MEKVRYPTKSILKQVVNIISEEDTDNRIALNKVSSKYDIPVEKLELFYQDYDFLNLEMYKIAAKLLGITLKEITSTETIDIYKTIETVKRRERKIIKTAKDTKDFNNLNKFNIEIFSNIIDILKLGGE
ncbi:hypothetical protein [Tissierella praeacuta]|uniref:hypothetical protein n=1 Tax=Tissierella praeacuta TaxID=43131 RepID=UPI0028A75536|nr:hypothetical protein [Tissierella praeacuta]